MAIPLDPSFREVRPPLTGAMLAPLDPRCRRVQLSSALSDGDYAALADWLTQYPQVTLRVYGGYDDRPFTDLQFLRYFPKLRGFEASSLHDQLANIDGLGYLPDDTFYLGLGETRKRLSLTPLQRFGQLQRLYLEGQRNDVEIIGTLENLTSLTLRSITLPDLTILTALKKLLALDLKLGSTHTLDLLPQVGKLQYLELWQIRGLDDISAISQIKTLQHLFLQTLRRVTQLPSLAACTQLTHVHLETMKGLTDLTPLLSAPALTDIALVDMGHLKIADVTVLRSHPTLQRFSAYLGSARKDRQIASELPLPPADPDERHPALDPQPA